MISYKAVSIDLSSGIKDFLSTIFEVHFILHNILVCAESILLQKRTFRNTNDIASAIVRVYTGAQPKVVDVLISC